MSSFQLKLWKNISGTERYYTITDASNQKVSGRELEWNANYPRVLTFPLSNKTTVAADNLLSSSFAGWDSGTGALAIGDHVEYSIYPTNAPTTLTRVFYGTISELSQGTKGILTIKAKDELEKFEHRQPSTIIHSSYRDKVFKDIAFGSGARAITGCTETGIVWPAQKVAIACVDKRTDLEGGTIYVEHHLYDSATGYFRENAQCFLAEGDGLIGIRHYLSYTDITTGGLYYLSIQADADGAPSGTSLYTWFGTVGVGTWGGVVQADFPGFLATNQPILIEKGRKYWVVFWCDDTIVAGTGGVGIGSRGSLPTYGLTTSWVFRILPSGSWTSATANRNLSLRLDFADYEDVAEGDCYLDDAADMIVTNVSTPIETVDTYYAGLYRGMVSYYYGTITTYKIFDTLLEFEPSITPAVDGDCDTTYSLYRTRGKSIGECLREMGDAFETTGARSGMQHSIAHYWNGTTNYIYVNFSPYDHHEIFSHASAPSAGADEVRIISTDLKRTTNMRPATVLVIGKSKGGAPILAQRDDRALSTSFRTKAGSALTMVFTDETITNLADADKRAWQILDAFSRDTWEGTITVSGLYPDLFDLNSASETYGAPGHIHLRYPQLGISATEPLYVKGIRLLENKTEIQVSNTDLLLMNAITDARGRAERSESFVAPDDPFDTVFINAFNDAVLTTTTLYMQLSTAASTKLTGSYRVPCTRLQNSRYNATIYHAEFERANGYSSTSTVYPVTHLELYTSMTSTTPVASVALGGEEFYKWRTTAVVAEMLCKSA